MNHPRRLLLLVPLALLGAALLVRSRLPRPQTEGDKWLWEQAETATRLEVSLKPFTQTEMGLTLPNTQVLMIRDHSGIRAVLRALEKTGPFVAPSPTSKQVFKKEAFVEVEVWQPHRVDTLCISNTKRGYFISHQPDLSSSDSSPKVATTHASSVQQMLQVLRSAITRAKRHEEGYRLAPAGY